MPPLSKRAITLSQRIDPDAAVHYAMSRIQEGYDAFQKGEVDAPWVVGLLTNVVRFFEKDVAMPPPEKGPEEEEGEEGA